MCPIKLDELKIDHLVDFTKDQATFAAARENGNNHLRIFLVYSTGNVYTRNGRADSWEELGGSARENIINRIELARASVPVYKINGCHS